MSRAREIGLRVAVPAAIWALCASVYTITLGDRIDGPTPDNHYVHLADALLHGQLEVIGNTPPGTNDWACYDEELGDVCPPSAFHHTREGQHWYVSFPPWPAIVLMPAVAIFGPRLPDALVWSIFAGLGPALLFWLLRSLRESGRSTRSVRDDLILVVLFAFGTVYFFSAVQGAVWFAAHVAATPLLMLYLLWAIDAKRPLLAGLMLGLAFMTRPTTAALVLVFLIEALRVSRAGEDARLEESASVPKRIFFWLSRVEWKKAWIRIAIFAAPILVIGALMMWMNEARWDRPFEFGHRYLMIRWRGRIETWGLFNYHYLSKNLAVFLASLPWLTASSPHFIVSRHGLALWVTTPNLLWVLWPKRKMDPTMLALALAALAVAIWNLLYQNSGWVQFGYRFALDYLPVLFVLLALGNRRFGGGFLGAALFAIAINTFGAITFDRAWQFYDDDATQDRVFQPD